MWVTVLTGDEGEEGGLELGREGEEKGEPLGGGQEVEYGTLELPLYSEGGVNHFRTMKLKGGIRGASVIAMIDSGASHNFGSKKLIDELGLEVDESVFWGIFG